MLSDWLCAVWRNISVNNWFFLTSVIYINKNIMSINLSNLSAAQRAQRARDRMFSRGILLAIFLLVVTGGILFALRVYNDTLTNEINTQENNINLKAKDLSGKDAVEVVNVADRIGDTLKYSTTDSVPLVFLERISALMSDGITLSEYSYSVQKDTIKMQLSATAENFPSIAAQIARLKESKDFDNVYVRDIERNDQTDKIQFVIIAEVAVEKPANARSCEVVATGGTDVTNTSPNNMLNN